jgi:phospholipase C
MMRRRGLRTLAAGFAVLLVAGATCSKGPDPELVGKIDHIIVIMQENRSFDSYFGTFPGADGISMDANGRPTICVPNSRLGTCLAPFHDPKDSNLGGPHDFDDALQDIANGHMTGFVDAAYDQPLGLLNGSKGVAGQLRASFCSANPKRPVCAHPDLMGWHDAREIPNYWDYAQNFVLQDHMFQPNFGPSEPAHLYMVSGWSAKCRNPQNPGSCVTNLTLPDPESPRHNDTKPDFGWTDLTYLLHKAGVDWAYYTDPSTRPDCDRFGVICGPEDAIVGTPNLWNPLPDFVDVHDDGEVDHIKPVADFFQALKDGTLPPVVWVVPNAKNSEHPPALISDGQAWVTSLINAIGRSSAWDTSAIFVTWDDWGGFYDHVEPPATRDGLGYSMRVPALLISPYARKGYIDHHTLSFDAYLKLIEDRFLGGQRLDPEKDGRWDPRPSVRENEPILGNLLDEFDLSQPPRPPLLLPTRPPPGPASVPGG